MLKLIHYTVECRTGMLAKMMHKLSRQLEKKQPAPVRAAIKRITVVVRRATVFVPLTDM